jgi:hypothetical protein
MRSSIQVWPYIATVSGGAPIGLRDHHRALDFQTMTSLGTPNVLAEKLLGCVRPNFCGIIRGSKHSTSFC